MKLFKTLVLVLGAIIILTLISLSEKYLERKETINIKEDSVRNQINEILENPRATEDIKRRASMVLSKLENDKLDPPFLVWAILGRAQGYEEVDLSFFFYDENEDIVGFGIRQEYFDGEGVVQTDERKYPIFEFEPQYLPAQLAHWPVRFMTKTDRFKANESEKLWQDYKENYIENKESSKWDELFVYLVSPLSENKISMWVYDREGNKSNTVPVLNRLDKKP